MAVPESDLVHPRGGQQSAPGGRPRPHGSPARRRSSARPRGHEGGDAVVRSIERERQPGAVLPEVGRGRAGRGDPVGAGAELGGLRVPVERGGQGVAEALGPPDAAQARLRVRRGAGSIRVLRPWASPRTKATTPPTARSSPSAPVGGTMRAASPARARLPYRFMDEAQQCRHGPGGEPAARRPPQGGGFVRDRLVAPPGVAVGGDSQGRASGGARATTARPAGRQR